MKQFLEKQYVYYNEHFDIAADPLSIPKSFTLVQDIEISGLLAATIAWGNRKAIVKSAQWLMDLMDNAPYQFVMQHTDKDLERIAQFYYRTFNSTDILYFVAFLQYHYQQHNSLAAAFFIDDFMESGATMVDALAHYNQYFFSLPYVPERTRKHVGNVAKKSACKRLNMFLRWMVRNDNIDFGLWNKCSTSQLLIPLDVHVGNVARKMGLLTRTQNDLQATVELTERLRAFDPIDPVKYDLVLFSMGIGKDLS